MVEGNARDGTHLACPVGQSRQQTAREAVRLSTVHMRGRSTTPGSGRHGAPMDDTPRRFTLHRDRVSRLLALRREQGYLTLADVVREVAEAPEDLDEVRDLLE